jgi:acetolactate synthase small subunit
VGKEIDTAIDMFAAQITATLHQAGLQIGMANVASTSTPDQIRAKLHVEDVEDIVRRITGLVMDLSIEHYERALASGEPENKEENQRALNSVRELREEFRAKFGAQMMDHGKEAMLRMIQQTSGLN